MKGAIGFLNGENPFQFSTAAPLSTFIVQMLVITISCRLIKFMLSPLKQPRVIAEVIGGIVLGPTVLGRIPGFRATIFPDASLPFLNLMSNFGLVLFLFLVGLELDPVTIRKSIRKSLAISLAGMGLPFCLGAAVSFGLYNIIEPETNHTPFGTYLLFLGVAMSITAFPVLARILTELGLLLTPVGSITVSAAAVDDAASWCLLALVISLINAGTGLNALWVFLMGVGYTLLLVVAVRPGLVYLCRRSGGFENGPSQGIVFLCLVLVFFSGFVTNAIGIDAIFGGFITGVIMPHHGGFARRITEKLEDLVTVLFLPLYFTLSGLKTQLGMLNDGVAWGMVLLVIAVACLGKLTGCALAARATGLKWRESLAIGVLMNCKGLVELIVLNIGLDSGVISSKTFAVMVIMALVTTFLTVPLILLVYPKSYYSGQLDEECQPTPSLSVVACVNRLENVPALMSLVQILSTPVGFNMTALRLIELTERTSTIMLQAEAAESMRMDPVASVFHTFSQLTAIGLRTLLRVVRPSEFATTVSSVARDAKAELVVVPWNGCGAIVDNLASPALEKMFRGPSETTSTSEQHSAFLRDLFQEPPCKIAVLVNRGLGEGRLQSALSEECINNSAPVQQIVIPFFGGRDDRAAVNLVVDSLTPSSHLTILHFVILGAMPTEPLPVSAYAMQVSSSEDMLNSKAEDELVLEALIGSSFSNFTYTRTPTKSPVASAVEALETQDRHDLIVVGRTKLGSLDALYGVGNPRVDNARRQVLGDVAESILLSTCPCSVLIVQENLT